MDINKRYQVFVSSTFVDLQEERQAVFRKILSLPCFPAGMEWFPAQTDEQWKVIQRVIDACDYYVLIIGNRYGSTTKEGLSYTEKEFDYAVSKGIPVLVFPHGNAGAIAFDKSEADDEKRKKLQAFKQKAMTDRVIHFWTSADGLAGEVAVALVTVMTNHPAIGWVRGDAVASEEILADLHRAHKRIAEQTIRISDLVSRLEKAGGSPAGIAGLDQETIIHFNDYAANGAISDEMEAHATWGALFYAACNRLLHNSADEIAIRMALTTTFDPARNTPSYDSRRIRMISDRDLKQIRIQLQAHDLINVKEVPRGQQSSFLWSLTESGRKLALWHLSVKADSQ
jgi:hypothetical protein